jgi:hypothetical protein
METFQMTEQELIRWRLVDEVLHKRLTQKEAAKSLDLSERQFRNILISYKKAGRGGLISKHREKVGKNKYDIQFKNKALQILAEKYSGYGPTLSAEKLREQHNINLSRETIRIWMIERGMWKEKRSRKKIHQRREPRACFGELIQGDGSHHIWLELSGIECCLMVFIDDATSIITGMYLAEEETLEAYYTTLKQHLQRYGRFRSLYLDRSAIAKTRIGENPTQLEKALKKLGIELILAYSAEAKGRVERANRTLQDRFIKYLKERGVQTISEANQMMDDFIQDYNKKFGKKPRSTVDLHRPLDKGYDLDLELRKIEIRKLTKDLCFSFKNITYKVKGLNSLPEDREVEIIQLENDEIKVRCRNQWLSIEKDLAAVKTPREKKILKLNIKWSQEKVSVKKEFTGWQTHAQFKKKTINMSHAFTNE